MNRIKIIIIILTFFISNFIFGQLEPGAKQISLSHADVAITNDVFSLFTNPAGLSKIKEMQFGVFYSPSPFGLKVLRNMNIAFNKTTNIGSFAIGLFNYGFKLYHENEFYIGYGNNYDEKFYFGFSTYYEAIIIENYGSKNFLNISIGGTYLLTEKLSLGFVLKNLLQNKDYSPHSTTFRSGISYKIFKNSFIHFSVFKEINFPISFSSGIEYDIIKYLSLRFGIQNVPSTFSAGIGINYSIFKIDYAINKHQELGLTHQFGMLINF